MKQEEMYASFYDLCKSVGAAFDKEWRGSEEWEKEDRLKKENLLFDNSYGGFSEDGREYKIYRPYTISFGNNKFLKQFSLFCNRLIVSHKVSRIDKDILYKLYDILGNDFTIE